MRPSEQIYHLMQQLKAYEAQKRDITMKNETIKTYAEITVKEAGEMLRDNGWTKPVPFMAFRDESHSPWLYQDDCYNALSGVSCNEGFPFDSGDREGSDSFRYCATVTEINPCQAPDGCPELEPFMAYVGILPICGKHGDYYTNSLDGKRWIEVSGDGIIENYAIDVRTEWAQEHFPEHCRIRNYQEPNALEEEWQNTDGRGVFFACTDHLTAKRYYELGQQNPTTK